MEPGAQGGGAGSRVITALRALAHAFEVSYAVSVSAGFCCADSTLFQMKEVIFMCFFFFFKCGKKLENIFVQNLTIS